MKKILIIALFLTSVYKLSGQSHGITYQAVIIDANPQEIPGIDVTGNYLPNQPLTVRFTIQDENEAIEYQEEQSTITDKFGMINLTIGDGSITSLSPVIFTGIDWDGTEKFLKVEISLGETAGDYTELSFQSLYFIPYAFHRNITATGTSRLNGQVTINADLTGNDDQFDAYPLRVEGGNQGIGIRIDGSRTSANNFITFWDDNGVQGRIEGQVDEDVYNDPQFIFDQAMFAAKTVVQVANVAIAAAASVVDPGNVGIEAANSALLAAEIAEYEIFAFSNLGVAYESGSGDYAEWLPRLYPDEKVGYGQIVGVYGGKITKRTDGADMLMVVSKAPIVLGNMPPDSLSESLCEKVAFMGQVPVWIVGKISKGDYVVSYKSNSGFGKAVSPSDLTIDQMSSIVGRSWTDASNPGVNLVNIVIGVKTNEWIGFLKSNTGEIDSLRNEVADLKTQIKKSDNILARIVPGYREAMDSSSVTTVKGSVNTDNKTKTAPPLEVASKNPLPVKPMTKEIVLESFSKAAIFLKEQGIDLSKNLFYSKLNSDPEYKEKVVNAIINSYNKSQTGSSPAK